MVDQVGVQRVVARHHHAERVAGAPAGAADLLPQRGAGAREAGEQHGVEAADVDAELERVGRGQAEQPTRRAAPPRARGAPRAGSRRGRPPPGRPGCASTSPSSRRAVAATVSAPRRERMNASVRTRSTTRSVSRSATSLVAERRTGAPFSPTPGTNGGSHRASAVRPRGEPSVGDRDDVETGQPPGRDLAARRRWPRRARRWGGRRRAPRRAAAAAGSGRRGRRRRRGSGGTRRPRRSAVSRRTATSARARAAASGAACRGWSGRTPPWSRVHSRISGVESPSWVSSAGRAVQPAEPAQRRELVLGERLGRREVEDARHRAAPSGRGWTRSRAARAAGSRATCPRRCRWRSRCAGRRGRGRRRRA